MAETIARRYRGATTHCGLTTYVIEDRTLWRQSLSCDLNQLLTLRGLTSFTPQTSVVVSSTNTHRV